MTLQHASSKANRQSLVEESARQKINAREAARLERQRALAETLRTKADAEERGEDIERAKNWEYTIEENDEWEKKLARKKRRADFEFHGKCPHTRNVPKILSWQLGLQMMPMLRDDGTRKTWTTSNLTSKPTTDKRKLHSDLGQAVS